MEPTTAVLSALLQAMRGRRSQVWLSRRLGYAFNQVYRWESGRTSLAWSDFVRIAEVCRVDVRAPLAALFAYGGDPSDAATLVHHLVGDAPLALTADKLGVPRGKVERWLAGKSEPALADVLRVMEALFRLARSFTLALSPGAAGPTIAALVREDAADLEAKQRFALLPVLTVVLTCFEQPQYLALARHDDAVVASLCGIPVASARDAVAALHAMGAIAARDGRYAHVPDFRHVQFTNLDAATRASLTRYWTERAAVAMSAPPSTGQVFHYLCFAVSKRVADELARRFEQFHHEMVNIIKSDDQPCEAMRVVNMHLFDPGRAAAGGAPRRLSCEWPADRDGSASPRDA